MSVRVVKERAAKMVAAGQLERAEVLLRQVLTQVPRDSQTWLRHAEVLKRLGREGDAVSSYRLAAQILDEEGHHPRAAAALKLALTLLPNDVDLIADIIRSEMRAMKPGEGVRTMFPVSSPSQLLAGASESPFSSSGSTVMTPQLALPMAPASRAETAESRSDRWVPEETGHAVTLDFIAQSAVLPVPAMPADAAAGDELSSKAAQDVATATTPLEVDALESDADATEPPAADFAVDTMVGTLGADWGAEAEPLPTGPPPSAPVRFEVVTSESWPQVRRLSNQQVAVRAAPDARWVVIESEGPLTVRFADALEVPDDAEWLE